MLSQELIKTLLESSLPLRLALLDAEPTGAGWMITMPGDWRLYEHPSKQERWGVENALCAWLPCNPLAIVEHAARLRFGADFVAALDSQPGHGYCAGVLRELPVDLQAVGAKAFGACPHTAAVALLREVVG